MTPNPSITPSVETIKEFMDLWGINRNTMATAIGMSKQSMSNKYSPSNVDKFSPGQHQQMVDYLKTLHQALGAMLREHV